MTKTQTAEIDALVLAYVTEHPGSRAGEIGQHLAGIPGFKERIVKAWTDAALGRMSAGKADMIRDGGWEHHVASEALQRLKAANAVTLAAQRWSPTDRSAWPEWAREAARQGWTPPKGWTPAPRGGNKRA